MRHFVEHLGGVLHGERSGVAIDQSAADEDAGEPAGGEPAGVDLAAEVRGGDGEGGAEGVRIEGKAEAVEEGEGE